MLQRGPTGSVAGREGHHHMAAMLASESLLFYVISVEAEEEMHSSQWEHNTVSTSSHTPLTFRHKHQPKVALDMVTPCADAEAPAIPTYESKLLRSTSASCSTNSFSFPSAAVAFSYACCAYFIVLCILSTTFWTILPLSFFFRQPPRVAICLAGGLRHFELTGPSIQEHLLSAYPNADVFVVTPLDNSTWKLPLLHSSHVVGVRVAVQADIPETQALKDLFHYMSSPLGRQGLLKYLGLVEGCSEIIDAYEQQKGFKYDWILRTRPDGVWHGRPTPLWRLSQKKFYIPPGGSNVFALDVRIEHLT